MVMSDQFHITTARLELVAGDTIISRAAAASDTSQLGVLLNATIPPAWPPEMMRGTFNFLVEKHEEDSDVRGWWLWHVVRREDRELIGGVGFKGRPTDEGRVDIGFAMTDPNLRRGYASEAVAALLAWAFADESVKRVVGETLEELQASIGLMTKLGFRFVCKTKGHDEGDPEVLQYELLAGTSTLG